MLSIEKLQKVRDLRGLAHILGCTPKKLSYILYIIPDEEKYRQFKVPKSGGGERQIKAPCQQLKFLQSGLSDLLQKCFEEAYGKNKYGRSLSHGFRKEHSIVTNASRHIRKRYVFNIDLKDFFPSINFGRVRGFFIKSRDFQLDPKVATVIAQIVCHENECPQGSPVSPVISNLIGHILDVHLVKLAKETGCTYSRYADDITFSTNEKNFPTRIALQSGNHAWYPSEELKSIVERSRFEINFSKVSMQYRNSRQMTTGLVVNKKVNIPSPYYRQARAMCHSLFERNCFYKGKNMDKGARVREEIVLDNCNVLRGILSYIYEIKKRHDPRDKKTERWKDPTAIHKLFRKFLYFDKFHNLQKPLIICEGKTDIIYLEFALKFLHEDFTSMYSIVQNSDGENEEKRNVDFLKRSNHNLIDEVMQLPSGCGMFKSFIQDYEKMMQNFKCSGQNHPVILLVDNDTAGREVLEIIKHKRFKKRRSKINENVWYVCENLYFIICPQKEGKGGETEIEDYFSTEVLEAKVEGKSFSRDENFEKDKYYGKSIFARKVVKSLQKSEDFKGFSPLLKEIEHIIENDYKERNKQVKEGKRKRRRNKKRT
jgi:5S rRNA maturation endonuclease (ribonuclease M5)